MLFKNSKIRAAFTIVELLTVMSIIMVLLSLLVPGLNQVRRYAKDVRQRNQLHAIEVGLDLYNAEWDEYPDANSNNELMCGATNLCEAMVGRDLLGYDPTGNYNPTDLSGRKMYLPIESSNAYALEDIYHIPPLSLSSGLDPYAFVLCDVYSRVRNIRNNNPDGPRKIGMPILYYKANMSKTTHDINDVDNTGNIYDYGDNYDLTELGLPWDSGEDHPLYTDPNIFYEETENTMINVAHKPMRADSYILLSAGYDGIYGTDDDIYNFKQ